MCDYGENIETATILFTYNRPEHTQKVKMD